MPLADALTNDTQHVMTPLEIKAAIRQVKALVAQGKVGNLLFA
jgi:hypothetical protein